MTRSYKITTKGSDIDQPYCAPCYAHRNNKSQMIEVESEMGGGTRQFRCGDCGHELVVLPPLEG